MTERALLTRRLDLFCVGGASIVVVLVALALPFPLQPGLGASAVLITHALVNWPHFMASYRVLYASRETVARHRLAAIAFPAALALYAAYAAATWSTDPTHVQLLQLASAVYLARHYTGQTWGMMASFAFVERVTFSERERRLVRWGLDVILLWHVSWAAAQVTAATNSSWAAPLGDLYRRTGPVFALAVVLGGAGLGTMTRRLGRLPPARVLVPWIALHLWYALLAKDPTAAVLVQAAHALQYLPFPLRIELNRSGSTPPMRLVARRLAAWLVLAFAVFAGLPALYGYVYGAAGGHQPMGAMMASVVASFVAIHHYFVDGALYKLRSPEVRRDLFAQLPAESG